MDIIVDIGRSPELKRLGLDQDHGDRRLGRDATHLAPDVMVQDQITHDQNAGLGKPLDMSLQRLLRRTREARLVPAPSPRGRFAPY